MIKKKDKGRCDCNVIHFEAVEAVMAEMPPKDEFNRVSNLYKMFADPTKIKILWALGKGRLCVCDLAVLLDTSKSAVSHSLALLKLSNLVKNERDGKTVYYHLADAHVEDILRKGFEHIKE